MLTILESIVGAKKGKIVNKKWNPTDLSTFRSKSKLSLDYTEKCCREIKLIESHFGSMSWVNTQKGLSVIDTIKWLALGGKRPSNTGGIRP